MRLSPSLEALPLEKIAHPLQRAGLLVTLQHPEIVAVFGGRVEKAFAIRGQAETNAGPEVLPGLVLFTQDLYHLLLESDWVEEKQFG